MAVEEFSEPSDALFITVGDLVEIFFHRCSEFVID